MDTGKVTITKLDGSNYLIWATQIEALLQARGIWEHVDGTAVIPARTADTFAQVMKSRNMARAAIICSIEAEYVPMVAADRDPQVIWDKLADMHKSKCTASIHTLRSRLLNLRMEQGTSIRAFVNEICTIERQLSFAGKIVEEDDKKYALLNGLRKEYHVKKTILQENYDTSFEKMVSSLEMTENELESSGIANKGSSSSGSSFMTESRNNASSMKCWICERKGHKMTDCFYNPTSSKFKSSMRPSKKIQENLRRKNLTRRHDGNVRDECDFVFMAERSHEIADKWFLDSCCSRHLTNSRDGMIDYKALRNSEQMRCASDKGSVQVVGVGNVKVEQIVNGKKKVTMLKDVGYAPNCRTNLVSLTKAQRIGVDIMYKGGGSKMIATYKGEAVMHGDSENTGISELVGMKRASIGRADVAFFNAGENDAMKMAHRRTCHTAVGTLRRMQETNAVHGLDALKSTKKVDNICEACVDGKAASHPHPRKEKSTTKVLELMHTDICGPIDPPSMHGDRYVQLMVDDYSGAIFMSTMPTREGAGSATKNMVLHAQKLTGSKVITVRPDGAKELKLGTSRKFLDENGTVIDDIPPYSPQSNGRAERPNRTLFEKARTILSELNMMCRFDGYKKLWPEALRCVVYVYNRTLTKSTHPNERNKTPFELMTGNKPDVSNLRIFGTRVKVLKPRKYWRSKVDAKVWDGIHVGYAPGDAYRCYIPELGRVFVSKDVTFIEKLYRQVRDVTLDVSDDSVEDPSEEGVVEDEPRDAEVKDDIESSEDNADDENFGTPDGKEKNFPWVSGDLGGEVFDGSASNPNTSVNELATFSRRSKRKSNAPNRYGDFSSLAFMTAEALSGNVSDKEPSSAGDAMKRRDKLRWKDAMVDEVLSLVDNNVFDVVKKPEGRKIVRCRWVFALKRNSRGEVVRYKARVVAKGYSQIHGVDYDEIYAPVVQYPTLRFLLAHVALNDMEMKQVDVKTAFLHGNLDEDIYMDVPKLPQEVIDELKEKAPSLLFRTGHVWKLKKSIYGLKQAAKQWYVRLKDVLEGCKLKPSTSDPCLFKMDGPKNERAYVLVYVDDIIIASACGSMCASIVEMLGNVFTLSAMDDAHFFLGMKIERDREARLLWLSQDAYVKKLVGRFHMANGKANIPMRTDLKLTHANDEEMEQGSCYPYRELVGSLMYLACTSRPDIMYATSYLARFVAFHGERHWHEAKRVVKYLASTHGMSICYGKGSASIVGYCDADWAGDHATRKSTSGIAFIYGGGCFLWKSKLQSIVAASSAEAEYVALSKCVRECLWMRKVMVDFGIKMTSSEIRCDNTGAIALSEDGKMSVATKHIATCYHLVRDYVRKNLVRISYVPSAKMVADGMTKALAKIKMEANLEMLGLIARSIDDDGEC